ncbi:hypothetical protein Mal64_35630 [Pseudobythopirellula maris]|uniref:MotA/TolQ/ExbB proton channel domain-containing protein n=1 Tax=Pseudobythopirellula maris TaxID=2527991 RepID=A0A5C5ZHB9_9BACT|nr:hypothetical protein [Pseudobythopirellula maris]TWT86734.1 hypothetical protein Mal64_35630 [Pseudobythopirellula maris]
MSTTNHDSRLGREGRAWLTQCLFLAGVVLVGLGIDQLAAFSVGAIVVLASVNGVSPYRRLAHGLQSASLENQRDDDLLAGLSINDADDVLTGQSDSTLHELAILKRTHSVEGATDIDEALLSVVREPLDADVKRIGDAGEQAALLAVAGSMVGLAAVGSSLGGQASVAAMSSGVVTMSATSVAGLFAAMSLLGLESRAEVAVEKHVNSLRVRLAGVRFMPAKHDPNRDSLFRRKA